jgi:hypothetical protein
MEAKSGSGLPLPWHAILDIFLLTFINKNVIIIPVIMFIGIYCIVGRIARFNMGGEMPDHQQNGVFSESAEDKTPD